jgi:GWxTD domain-containing protein
MMPKSATERNPTRFSKKHRKLVAFALTGAAAIALPAPTSSQTMPTRTYFDLGNAGHEKLAKRISRKLELRSDPDDGDVRGLLEAWERETGGPVSGWDQVTVARLWIRAGDADAAEGALDLARESGEVPDAALLLDEARIEFVRGNPDLAATAYWEGCRTADEASALEYWLDIESLATPAEMEEWDRFRRLPIPQRDLCSHLRRFWAERSLASGLPIDARMDQHYERVRLAMDQYSRRGSKKAPTFSNDLGRPRNAMFDDRGLIFIRFGDPDRVTSFAGNPSIQSDIVSAECYQPNESWAYDYPDGTRIYHFSAAGGIDDYWLIENLGLVYRCGNPAAGASSTGVAARLTPLNENRFVPMGSAAALVLTDLYMSRQGLDSRYAQAASRMSDPNARFTLNSSRLKSLEAARVLQEERDWTREDGEFAISTIPERPAVKENVRFIVEELQFLAAAGDSTRVWLNGVVEGANLTPSAEPDGGFRYHVDARWLLMNEAGELRRVQSGFETLAPKRLGRDESIPIRLALDLPAGDYRYTFIAWDGYSEAGEALPSGNFHRGDILVRRFAVTIPDLSDVAIASDSGGNWTPAGPGGYVAGIRPSPAHLTGPDGVAYVFFETYGLEPGASYTTNVRLEPAEGDGDPFVLSFPGVVPMEQGPRVGRALRLDLSDSEPGQYRMSLSVKDESSGEQTLPYETEIMVRRERG